MLLLLTIGVSSRDHGGKKILPVSVTAKAEVLVTPKQAPKCQVDEPLRGLCCCELKPEGWRNSVGLVGVAAPGSGLGCMCKEAGVDLLTSFVL